MCLRRIPPGTYLPGANMATYETFLNTKKKNKFLGPLQGFWDTSRFIILNIKMIYSMIALSKTHIKLPQEIVYMYMLDAYIKHNNDIFHDWG